jgi:hypothetical protein
MPSNTPKLYPNFSLKHPLILPHISILKYPSNIIEWSPQTPPKAENKKTQIQCDITQKKQNA